MAKGYSTKDVTLRPGIFRITKDVWVWCDNGDPKKAIYFMGHSIQGNQDRGIAEIIGEDDLVFIYPNAKLVKIDWVFQE